MSNLLGILLIWSQPSFAGGDISEEELEKYHQQCHTENRGDACVVLAEQTLCGRGFNEETQVLMNAACKAYQKRCAQKEQDSCQGYRMRCLLPCLSVEFDIGEYININQGAGDCGNIYPRASKEKRQEKIRTSLLSSLETSCSSQYPKNCELLGDIYVATDVTKSEKFWQRACEFKVPEGCMKWGTHLRKKGREAEMKGCALDQEQDKRFRHQYQYRNICEEHEKNKK